MCDDIPLVLDVVLRAGLEDSTLVFVPLSHPVDEHRFFVDPGGVRHEQALQQTSALVHGITVFRLDVPIPCEQPAAVFRPCDARLELRATR